MAVEYDAAQLAVELRKLHFFHLHKSLFAEREAWYYFLTLANKLRRQVRRTNFLFPVPRLSGIQDKQLRLGSLVQVKPNCDTDVQLLEKWTTMGRSYGPASFPLVCSNLSGWFSKLITC